MAKLINILFVVILIAFISELKGDECTVDIGYNICTGANDDCLKTCKQASFYLIYKASCQISPDGSTFCECIFNCVDATHKNNNNSL
ncbi:hypothetical protein R3W88_000060 [Solanum pinnatisectum]|uniref:Defensin-like protein n=1 Tax=Solanum pinnatisectum TaxID=50273 RepID=A0AAV9MG52_9SOLN|nr:hypothetical protein R3W88_000060 [Solanum pinnatisectum]